MFDIITQIQYNNWANKRILSAAVNIPPDQLTANADLSYGSAFETLRHMLDVEWSWRLACEEIPATELLWNIEPLDDLIAVTSYWEAEGERLLAFASVLPEEDFTREVTPSWMKLSCQIQHILMHIVHHATDHRSEVGWHLTRLGHSPGDLGFLEFINSLQK